MSLIFRSLKLSFPVFLWSLLIVPLIFSVLGAVIYAMWHLLREFAIVPVVILLAGTFLLPLLIMMRIALSRLGEVGPPAIGPMFKSGFVYGPALLGFNLVIFLGGWLALYAYVLGTGTSIHMLNLRNFVMAVASAPVALFTMEMISFLISAAFFAAILVPMAGSASGEDEYRRRPAFFYGFGASFLPLFVICAVIPAPFYANGAVMSAETLEFMSQMVLTVEEPAPGLGQRGGYSHTLPSPSTHLRIRMPKPQEIGGTGILGGVVQMFLSFWYYAWVCSAAALAFVRHWEEVREDDKDRSKLRRIDPADLREFRKSRKP